MAKAASLKMKSEEAIKHQTERSTRTIQIPHDLRGTIAANLEGTLEDAGDMAMMGIEREASNHRAGN